MQWKSIGNLCAVEHIDLRDCKKQVHFFASADADDCDDEGSNDGTMQREPSEKGASAEAEKMPKEWKSWKEQM